MGARWTPEEDALMRRHYPWASGRKLLATLLPHRTAAAREHRASDLAIPRRRRRWTAEEVRTLLLEWGEVSPRTLREKLPGRTWLAIYEQATKVMGLAPPQQEMVSLGAAARRAGFSHQKLRSILERRGVEIEQYRSGSVGERRSQARYRVDPIEVQDAVEAELAALRHGPESISEGAMRLGMSPSALRSRLADIGALVVQGRGRASRYSPEIIDRAAMSRSSCPGRERGMAPACRERGIPISRARRWLADRGIRVGQGSPVPEHVVTRMIADLTRDASEERAA